MRRFSNDELRAIARFIAEELRCHAPEALDPIYADPTDIAPSGGFSSIPPEVMADVTAEFARSKRGRRRRPGSPGTSSLSPPKVARSGRR